MTTMSVPAEAVWVTQAQAAAMVQVDERTIRRWASCGRFPRGIPLDPENPRSKKRWVRAEVEAWLRDREAEPRS